MLAGVLESVNNTAPLRVPANKGVKLTSTVQLSPRLYWWPMAQREAPEPLVVIGRARAVFSDAEGAVQLVP